MKWTKLVYNFRKAIEAAQENDEAGIFFWKFPKGQCGDTSDMLCQYLLDHNISPIIYENGTYYGEDPCNDKQSHAWLVVDGMIVDITGDQFKNFDEPLKHDIPVYIGPKNEYYELFELNPGGSYEHFGIQKSWLNYQELMQCYKTILKYI